MKKSELKNKAWYRLLQVLFAVFVAVVVALTFVVWYLIHAGFWAIVIALVCEYFAFLLIRGAVLYVLVGTNSAV